MSLDLCSKNQYWLNCQINIAKVNKGKVWDALFKSLINPALQRFPIEDRAKKFKKYYLSYILIYVWLFSEVCRQLMFGTFWLKKLKAALLVQLSSLITYKVSRLVFFLITTLYPNPKIPLIIKNLSNLLNH